MSGRLVILPHKSWNVYNTDNVEKVLRDERLEKERQEREAKEQRRRDQEEIHRELLRPGGGADVDVERHSRQKQTDPAPVEPFCLFDEPKAANSLSTAVTTVPNADYIKEREQKELARKRHEGIAPLPLGGYTDSSTTWYTQRRPLGGEDGLVGDKRRRDHMAKQRDDPMTTILKYTKTMSVVAAAANVHEDASKVKADRRSKKDKHRDQVNAGISKSEMEVLRKKRLEREAKERKKSNVLLAAMQVNASR